ncbi:putative transcriptional regulator [Streptococcus gallolyticus]|uniref:Putative transcriptional regulator n=2 Tax=Streptococcus gallolyticus TaxID=315405 RepID=A0A139R467_9STRE|nr:putative transcriptional regulator [Streptococcus gallolyticus]KXU09547.1 putative transcriptional regulator [Streptococcus gallolyticus]
MSTSQIISVLSANRFLTQNEIERTLGYSLSKSETAFLKASPKIVLFNFYGRIYYKLNNDNTLTTEQGRQAIAKLSRRPQAIKLGEARTCLHHLAGKAGVSIFEWFIQNKLMEQESPINYSLTQAGSNAIQQWLGYQSNPNIKLCLDFSERKFHIGGVLGEKILEKLIHEGKCQLTQDRQIILKTDLNNLMKDFYK